MLQRYPSIAAGQVGFGIVLHSGHQSSSHPMFVPTIQSILQRDLDQLRSEITAYRNEANLWRVQDGITNSAGNLCLHLVGNLNWFIGAQLGNTGYARDRPLEFSTKDVPRAELLAQIDATIAMVSTSLDQVTSEDLTADYPLVVFAEKTTTMFFLVHLTTHLSYHLGQINYHRRILES